MIEDIGKILKGAFFIIAGVVVFGLGISLGYFGLGDDGVGDVSLSGAATVDADNNCQCPTYECKALADKCELVKIGETTCK